MHGGHGGVQPVEDPGEVRGLVVGGDDDQRAALGRAGGRRPPPRRSAHRVDPGRRRGSPGSAATGTAASPSPVSVHSALRAVLVAAAAAGLVLSADRVPAGGTLGWPGSGSAPVTASGATEPVGPGEPLEEENRRLRRELAEARRANEILKAASAFFAAELDRPTTK